MVVPIRSNIPRRCTWAGAIACLAAALATSPVQAQAPGDASRGQLLSETWCSSCHLVSPANRTSTNDGAPSFDAIARQPTTTSTGLRVFLQTPHPRMPNDVLSAVQTDDIVAYILSLKR
jgi:mono/diheme cytochrome c family protein